MTYLQTLVGLVLLFGAGDYLVRGAASLATRAGVSKLVIGLTVVAFGTSAPELVVGVNAVISGAPTLALGNVVGSNIANILLVLGIPALIAPICCNVHRVGRNLMLMLGVSVLLVLLAYTGELAWLHGLVLLTLFGLFVAYSALRSKDGVNRDADPEIDFSEIPEEPDSYPLAAIFLVAGLAGIVIGSEMLVAGSVAIARDFGIREDVIGLTLVALGTSLPELATSVMAALRRHNDVAIGTVIGSNIFNILAILGISSLTGAIPVPETFLTVDLWVMLASGLLLVPYCWKKLAIGRISGLVMLGLYGLYLAYLSSHGSVQTADMTPGLTGPDTFVSVPSLSQHGAGA